MTHYLKKLQKKTRYLTENTALILIKTVNLDVFIAIHPLIRPYISKKTLLVKVAKPKGHDRDFGSYSHISLSKIHDLPLF